MTMLDSLQNEQLKKLLRHPDMRLKDEAEIPDRLKCICCHKLLLRAMQTPCSCKICSDCFSEYIGHQNSIKCPTNQPDCQEEMLTKDNVHPDNATNKEILRLKVNCPYADCKEVDTVQTIHSQHMDVCDRRSIKCDQCSEDIVFVDKPDHIKSKCIMRTVECPHCQKKMRSWELKERHLNVELGPEEANELCSKYVAICPNACGTKEKVNARDHLRECPNKRTECPVTLSCDSNKMTAAKLRDHMTKEAYKHFSAIVSELKQLRKDLNDANIKLSQQEKYLTETNQSWSKTCLTVTGLEKQIEDLKKRVNNPTSSMNPSSLYSGDRPVIFRGASYIWKITEFTAKKKEAENGITVSITSDPFYTSEFGYKMCLRIYPFGDGVRRSTHLSVFFVIMRGDYDNLLAWPFRQKVTLSLLDQEGGSKHHSDTFKPYARSAGYQKPTDVCNIESGSPKIILLSTLMSSLTSYLKDDKIFVKIAVDVLNICKP